MKKLLLIVDVQNGFLRSKTTKIIPKKISQLIEEGFFDEIWATKFINKQNSMYVKSLGWDKMIALEEQEIPKIIKNKIDKIWKKEIYSGVSNKMLKELKKDKYKIFIAGIDTDNCVLKTAVDFWEHNIESMVLLSYSASNSRKNVNKTVEIILKRFIGKRLVNNDKYLNKEKLEKISKNIK